MKIPMQEMVLVHTQIKNELEEEHDVEFFNDSVIVTEPKHEIISSASLKLLIEIVNESDLVLFVGLYDGLPAIIIYKNLN